MIETDMKFLYGFLGYERIVYFVDHFCRYVQEGILGVPRDGASDM